MIPAEAVEAAVEGWLEKSSKPGNWKLEDTLRVALETAAPLLIAGVAALHYPQGESYKTCAHCIRPSGYPNRPEQPVRWPCPTAAAAGLG